MQKLSDRIRMTSDQFIELDTKYKEVYERMLVKYNIYTPLELKENQQKIRNFFAEIADNLFYLDNNTNNITIE